MDYLLTVEDNYAKFMSAASNQILNTGNLFNINESSYEDMFYIIELIRGIVKEIVDAIFVAFCISITIASLSFLLNSFYYLLSFRNRILLLRRG